MKYGKSQNLSFLFRKKNFLELPKYFWNLQMLSIIGKFKNWKKIKIKIKIKNNNNDNKIKEIKKNNWPLVPKAE